MKIVKILLCTLVALTAFACTKDEPENAMLPQEIRQDFNTRYPGAKVRETQDRTDSGVNYTDVFFIDKDRCENMAVYQGETWLMTQKTYDIGPNGWDIKRVAPKVVADVLAESDLSGYGTKVVYHYLVEITRDGMDQKQYEVLCNAPYVYYRSYTYHFIIAEDGTLLSVYERYGDSIEYGDMRMPIAFVRDKYQHAKLIGAAKDAEGCVLFIRQGGYLKTVKFKNNLWGDLEWAETTRELPLDTALPSYVEEVKESVLTPALFKIYYVERPDGQYYQLLFGTDWMNYSSCMIKEDYSKK